MDPELRHVGGRHRQVDGAFDLPFDRFLDGLPAVAPLAFFFPNPEYPADRVKAGADKGKPCEKCFLVPGFLFERRIFADAATKPTPDDITGMRAFERVEDHHADDAAVADHRLRCLAVAAGDVGEALLNIDRSTARSTLESRQNTFFLAWFLLRLDDGHNFVRGRWWRRRWWGFRHRDGYTFRDVSQAMPRIGTADTR